MSPATTSPPVDAFVPGLLRGKAAFVAEGGRGINFRITRRLVTRGARIAMRRLQRCQGQDHSAGRP